MVLISASSRYIQKWWQTYLKKPSLSMCAAHDSNPGLTQQPAQYSARPQNSHKLNKLETGENIGEAWFLGLWTFDQLSSGLFWLSHQSMGIKKSIVCYEKCGSSPRQVKVDAIFVVDSICKIERYILFFGLNLNEN